MKRNPFRKKINIIAGILLFCQIFCVGCSLEEDSATYKIQYKVTSDIKTNLIINYYTYKDVELEILFYGSQWQNEFKKYLESCSYEEEKFTPRIYVKNNTDNDANITVEIIINGQTDKSQTISGPYAEIELKGNKLKL